MSSAALYLVLLLTFWFAGTVCAYVYLRKVYGGFIDYAERASDPARSPLSGPWQESRTLVRLVIKRSHVPGAERWRVATLLAYSIGVGMFLAMLIPSRAA